MIDRGGITAGRTHHLSSNYHAITTGAGAKSAKLATPTRRLTPQHRTRVRGASQALPAAGRPPPRERAATAALGAAPQQIKLQ